MNEFRIGPPELCIVKVNYLSLLKEAISRKTLPITMAKKSSTAFLNSPFLA